MKRTALIIGAGPAGLTAALELLRRSDIVPIMLEADTQVGGISRTVNHLGNRIDIGGHRFFSKSDWVMNWWKEILPVQADSAGPVRIAYQNKSRDVDVAPVAGADPDRAMLLRGRLSRIYYLRRFFDYPIKLSAGTLGNLGPLRVLKIGTSYAWARLFPRKPERSLEDFLVNRFGRQLYLTFFRDYTEKVWGVPCHEISAEWGAQRIKGLSVSAALRHALSKLRDWGRRRSTPRSSSGSSTPSSARARCGRGGRASARKGRGNPLSTSGSRLAHRKRPPGGRARLGCGGRPGSRVCMRLCVFNDAGARSGCRHERPVPRRGARGGRGAALPRLHHRRAAGEEDARQSAVTLSPRQQHAAGQLDLHPGK
jgi:hypothetical protein